LMAWSMETR